MIKVDGKYYARAKDPHILKKGECGGALTSILKYLLNEKIVDAVLTVKKGLDLYDAVPVLIDDPDELVDTAGSLHCGTLNIASLIPRYLDGARKMKMAVVSKPCDVMALVELAKKNEIQWENLILLGINCGGTLPPVETCLTLKEYGINPEQVLDLGVSQGDLIIKIRGTENRKISLDELEEKGEGRRPNCRRCEYNLPELVDLAFGNWGVLGNDVGEYTFIDVKSKLGAEILQKSNKYIELEEAPARGVDTRLKIDQSMKNMAHAWQDKDFRNREEDLLSILFAYSDEFSKCIKCYGCHDSCPVYINKSNHELNLHDRSTLPSIPLFHLERFIQMIDSCVNCGQCEDVCPMDIPLSRISHEMNKSIEKMFNYQPGTSHQKPPLSYFKF